MINKLKTLFNSIFNIENNKYYWYSIRYVYLIDNKEIFNITREIGVKNKKNIINKRTIKKFIGPLHTIKTVQKLLNNGHLYAEILCYLGKFEK